MALIECPECASTISDRAAACPSCGAPPTPAAAQSIDTPEVPEGQHYQGAPPTVESPSQGPAASTPRSFLFGSIYAYLCFFASFIAALLALIAASQIVQTGDWLHNVTTQRNTGFLLAMIFLFTLWSATGIAILRRRKFAIKLAWIGAVAAGIGILVRGFVPTEVALAIPTFIIIGYLRSRSALLR